jgi:ribosomal protein L13
METKVSICGMFRENKVYTTHTKREKGIVFNHKKEILPFATTQRILC